MRDRERQLASWGGVAFLLVILASEFLKGDSPSPSGPPTAVFAYLEEHRSGILAGAYVQMLGLFLFAVVMLLALERLLDEGRRRATVLAGLGVVLVLVSYSTYVLLTAAAAFGAGADLGPETTKALWQVRFVSETFIAFPAALLVGAFAAAALATRSLPRWYAWASVAVAGTFLVGGATLRRYGTFAPDGDYGFVLFWLLPFWTAVTGFVVGDTREEAGERQR
jgi:hypothetical protein